MVKEINWCDTEVCLADILTKSGSKLTEKVLEVIRENVMIDLRYSKKKGKEVDADISSRRDPGTI